MAKNWCNWTPWSHNSYVARRILEHYGQGVPWNPFWELYAITNRLNSMEPLYQQKIKREFHGIFIFVFPLKSKIAPSNQGLSMAIISQISCQLSFLQFSFIWAPSVFWSDHGRSTRSVHGPKVGPVKSCPLSLFYTCLKVWSGPAHLSCACRSGNSVWCWSSNLTIELFTERLNWITRLV